MRIEQFEDINAWKLARELTNMVYTLSNKPDFSRDFGLKDQIRRAAGSTMHNIAEGFDAESTLEFIRFLRYSKRSCTEVQSELYVALDQQYITKPEFQKLYNQICQTRAAIHGFIQYLQTYKKTQRGKQPQLQDN